MRAGSLRAGKAWSLAAEAGAAAGVTPAGASAASADAMIRLGARASGLVFDDRGAAGGAIRESAAGEPGPDESGDDNVGEAAGVPAGPALLEMIDPSGRTETVFTQCGLGKNELAPPAPSAFPD